MLKNFTTGAKERFTRICVGLGVSCFVFAIFFVHPQVIVQLDRSVYDIFLRLNAGGEPSPTPALIDIDEKSLAAVGQWPWPRHIVGKLVSILTEKGAASIALDIILAEPDTSSVKNLQKSFKQHFGIDLALDNIPSYLQDNDLILSGILAQTPSVLGYHINFSGETKPIPHDVPPADGINMIDLANTLPVKTNLVEGKSIVLPLPELRKVADIGFVNSTPDSDGIVRSAFLVAKVGEHVLVSLSMRALMRAVGENSIGLISGPNGLRLIKVGDYTVQVDESGKFNVPYRGPRKYYPTFSAVDILENKIPAEEIRQRIFIVGTSAPGLLDLRATPLDPIYPGAEIHATVIDAVLSQNFIQVPFWNTGVQAICLILISLLATIIFATAPPVSFFPIFSAFIIATLGSSWYVFQQGLYFSPFYIILLLILISISLLGVRFWQEAKQKRTLRKAFSRYIAPDMVNRIVDRGEVVLSGEEREVSLLFTDIRGFTTLSESLKPNQVVQVLNRYFTPMTSIIRASNGTVDKFIGDAVMAFWNAPLDVVGHPLKAIQSAMAMHTALEVLNQTFQQEKLNIQLNMGAGVHTGKVYVGNMGSEELLDYTCIGDSVNLASRLESLCPTYGMNLVTSFHTVEQCKEFAITEEDEDLGQIPYFLPLDSIRVKGKQEAIEIFTPMSDELRESRAEEIEIFLHAKQLYVSGEFGKALQFFLDLSKNFELKKLYELYAMRCNSYKDSPPKDWDGVWRFVSK